MYIKLSTLVFLLTVIASCQNNQATQIADNTFVYDKKIYKLIDNELTQIGDLNAKEIRKFEILKPQEKSLGTHSLSYITPGVSSKVDALYRGNYLYFKFSIEGINDLREKYYPGKFTLEFVDEFGFLLHSTQILTSELTGIVGDNGEIQQFEYNGKTEMSTEINSAIKSFSVSSTVKEK